MLGKSFRCSGALKSDCNIQISFRAGALGFRVPSSQRRNVSVGTPSIAASCAREHPNLFRHSSNDRRVSAAVGPKSLLILTPSSPGIVT